jgi:D-glycero-D-manno-heptose 1,7-bisphosphate phosphatase
MGRFSSSASASPSTQPNQSYTSSPYQSPPYPTYSYNPGAVNTMNPAWPTAFPNPMVSLDLNGTLIEYVKNINDPSQVIPIPGVLEAVKQLRLKGHKVFILADFPGIHTGKQSIQGSEAIQNHLMQLLGQAGCQSIDGMLFNTSDQKNDMYAKPNIGMINRAKSELKMDFSNGYYVGDSVEDLTMAVRAKITPVLVLTGQGEETLKKIKSFLYKDLYARVKVFDSLPAFVNSL